MTHTMKCSTAFYLLFCLWLPHKAVAQSDTETKRVSFTLSNPTLKALDLDIRYFDPKERKRIGYGYHLGPLQSHADNKPAGTRIYLKKDGQYELLLVLSNGDDGTRFKLNKSYNISQEQRSQVLRDELAEQNAVRKNPDADDDLAAFAERHDVPMVAFVVTGKTAFKRQMHVRAQLPFVEARTNTGFSRKISSFQRLQLSYPAGTRIFLCEGPYWNSSNVKETLLLTLDADKQGYLLKI